MAQELGGADEPFSVLVIGGCGFVGYHLVCHFSEDVTGTPKDYDKVTIQGTKDLLIIAKKSKDLRALIYTSSSLLCKGPQHVNLTEESPLADSDPRAPAYAKAKALAEKLVLSANEPLPVDELTKKVVSWEGHLFTGALRLPIVYGTHDLVCIPGALNALKQVGQTWFWVMTAISGVFAASKM